MVLGSETETHFRTLHVDGTLLELGPEEEEFFKAETRIQDPEELRKHVVKVHEEAYEVGARSVHRSIERNPVATLCFACRSTRTRAFERFCQ